MYYTASQPHRPAGRRGSRDSGRPTDSADDAQYSRRDGRSSASDQKGDCIVTRLDISSAEVWGAEKISRSGRNVRFWPLADTSSRRQSDASQAHQQRAKEFDSAGYRQRQTQEQAGF